MTESRDWVLMDQTVINRGRKYMKLQRTKNQRLFKDF